VDNRATIEKGTGVSRTISRRTASISAICAVLVSSTVLPFTAFAQNNDGGFLASLKISERFIGRDTDSPDLTEDGTTLQAVTDVELSITSETRTEVISLDLGGGYRFVDDPTTDSFSGEFTDPSVRLTYGQDTISSAFNVSASASRRDLDRNTSALDFAFGADGTLDPDFADLAQTVGGTRDRLSFAARLSLRDDAPFGLNFAVDLEDISYNGLPDSSTLSNNTYGRIEAGARFDISPVMQANLGVHFSQTDISGSRIRDRYGIDAGVVLTRPNGTITVDLSATDGDDGSQAHLSLGRSFTLEHTTASFDAGISKASNDDVFVTAAASLQHTFADNNPFGTITATASRDLTRSGRTDEDLVTSVSLETNYALSPLVSVRLTAGYARSEDIITDDTIDLARANLAVSYDLTNDWAASAGIGIQSRDPSGEATTDSTTFSVGLSRSFDLRR
jgi:hypothetical protein